MNSSKNLFNEEGTVAKIYLSLDQKNYQELFQILNRLRTFEPIIELYFSFVEELRKHTYTNQQLLAIARLLYRLSNLDNVNVELPETLPKNSLLSIANILRNKGKLNHSFRIDAKIKEIIKNIISHYKIEIKRNNKYNNTNTGRLALKLKIILYNFIVDYTKPESSEPLFPRDSTRNQTLKLLKIPGKKNMNNGWSQGIKRSLEKMNLNN
jgi:hypothetical protein